MKQPENKLVIHESVMRYYVLVQERQRGVWAYDDEVLVASATTEAAAWRKAVRRLERLLKEAKKKAGME